MPEMEQWTALGGVGRKRADAVVESLARQRSGVESLAELAHDARNMVTALGLYCDLLEEPGVLGAPFRHYGSELRLVAAASRRLVEKMVELESGFPLGNGIQAGGSFPLRPDGRGALSGPAFSGPEGFRGKGRRAAGLAASRRWEALPPIPIESLEREVLANRNLLAALAGPLIALTVEVEGGALPVRLTGEDLTRILVNLVKNAAEAMVRGGRIQLRLREQPVAAEGARWMRLTIEDSGPGIPGTALDRIFEPGYSTRSGISPPGSTWPATHRGLGLSITRSLVETAGGRIRAAEGSVAGACFAIELPVRTL